MLVCVRSCIQVGLNTNMYISSPLYTITETGILLRLNVAHIDMDNPFFSFLRRHLIHQPQSPCVVI